MGLTQACLGFSVSMELFCLSSLNDPHTTRDEYRSLKASICRLGKYRPKPRIRNSLKSWLTGYVQIIPRDASFSFAESKLRRAQSIFFFICSPERRNRQKSLVIT